MAFRHRGATVGERWVFAMLHDASAEAAGVGQRDAHQARVKAVKTELIRGTPFKDLVAAAEREIIMASLEANGHHVSNTARELQLERSHLYKKMRALGIDHRADDEGA